MSTTYNISRAYTYPRNKRAIKAVRILRKKMEKNEEEFEISNELNNHIWKRGIQRPPKKVTVEFEDVDGKRVAVPVEADKQTVSQPSKDTEETSEADGSVLDGTVSEAKEAVSDMENPDYEQLLELEKDGKNRKTLVEWLEGKVE